MTATMLVIAPVFLLVAVGVGGYEWHFLRHAVMTQGVVQKMVRLDSDSDDNTSNYAPVFSFEVAGVKHVVQSNLGSNPPGFVVGQSVPVLYDPADTEHAQIRSWGEQWGLLLVFGIGAPITGLVGVVMRVVRGPRNLWDYVPFPDSTSR